MNHIFYPFLPCHEEAQQNSIAPVSLFVRLQDRALVAEPVLVLVGLVDRRLEDHNDGAAECWLCEVAL
jgi:hypothetical protein